MELGTAIKEIRKQKGLSQKQLADRISMSVNALCQIELNKTFPQKSTVTKICEALSIPESFLLFHSLREEDVPEEKRQAFNILSKAIRDILIGEDSLI